jgi:hypothetical protein
MKNHNLNLAALAALGLTIESVFVPFSQSRNRAEKHKSLNWKVTLCRNGKTFLTCDYSAGIAHCPGYNAKESLASAECESGRIYKKGAILPAALDVFYSVVMDSSVLDYATHAEWGAEFGYDPDSIKCESIYRTCLSHTLALRSAIGESGIEILKTAFEDY